MEADDYTYPNTPGHAKLSDTSRKAAKIIEPSVSKIHKELLIIFALNRYEELFIAGGLTSDEAAILLRRSKYYIRQRCSELNAFGYLVSTSRRRRNGNFTYCVLGITEKGIAALRGME